MVSFIKQRNPDLDPCCASPSQAVLEVALWKPQEPLQGRRYHSRACAEWHTLDAHHFFWSFDPIWSNETPKLGGLKLLQKRGFSVSSRLMPDVFRKKTGTYGFHVGLGELDGGSTIPLFSDTGYTFRDATFHGFYDCLETGSLIWACSIHGTSLQSSTIFAEVSAWEKTTTTKPRTPTVRNSRHLKSRRKLFHCEKRCMSGTRTHV